MRHNRRSNGRWLVVFLALAAIVLAAEGFALVLSQNDSIEVSLPSDTALAAPSTPSVAPSEGADTQRTPRPRTHLESPRPASLPTAVPTAIPAAMPLAKPAASTNAAGFLDDYLRRHNSPLTGLGNVFWEQGHRHNVDPRLLVAISGNETGFGRLLTSRFNAFNWFYQGMWYSDFNSWEEAIATVTRGIREYYLDEGRTNLALLGEKYGPIGAENDPENLNVNFVPNVTVFLRELGGDPERLTFE